MPWKLRSRWLLCLHYTTNIDLMITHILRKAKFCADSLASICLNCKNVTWFNYVHQDIIKDYLCIIVPNSKLRICTKLGLIILMNKTWLDLLQLPLSLEFVIEGSWLGSLLCILWYPSFLFNDIFSLIFKKSLIINYAISWSYFILGLNSIHPCYIGVFWFTHV